MTEKKQRFTIDVETENYENAFFYGDKFICFEDDFDRILETLNVLVEENEQLKAQLRKGEDVCSICKHQYLTKTNTDEYYIAKCKKEHLECSRGTVKHCEDFDYNCEVELNE